MLGASLILVGAEKGGVGKTTVTRLAAEYFLIKGNEVRIYDTQTPQASLKRYLPGRVELIDLADSREQCRLFDSLDALGRVTLIDLKAGALFATLRSLDESGVFEAAAEGGLKISLLHVIGGSRASISEIEEIGLYRAALGYRLVRNLATGGGASSFRRLGGLNFPFGEEIVIPRLEPLAFEAVELAGCSFSSFVLGETDSSSRFADSFVLRGYVSSWLGRAWDGFEAAGLDNLAGLPEQIAHAASSKTSQNQREATNEQFQTQ